MLIQAGISQLAKRPSTKTLSIRTTPAIREGLRKYASLKDFVLRSFQTFEDSGAPSFALSLCSSELRKGDVNTIVTLPCDTAEKIEKLAQKIKLPISVALCSLSKWALQKPKGASPQEGILSFLASRPGATAADIQRHLNQKGFEPNAANRTLTRMTEKRMVVRQKVAGLFHYRLPSAEQPIDPAPAKGTPAPAPVKAEPETPLSAEKEKPLGLVDDHQPDAAGLPDTLGTAVESLVAAMTETVVARVMERVRNSDLLNPQPAAPAQLEPLPAQSKPTLPVISIFTLPPGAFTDLQRAFQGRAKLSLSEATTHDGKRRAASKSDLLVVVRPWVGKNDLTRFANLAEREKFNIAFADSVEDIHKTVDDFVQRTLQACA